MGSYMPCSMHDKSHITVSCKVVIDQKLQYVGTFNVVRTVKRLLHRSVVALRPGSGGPPEGLPAKLETFR